MIPFLRQIVQNLNQNNIVDVSLVLNIVNIVASCGPDYWLGSSECFREKQQRREIKV